MIVNCKKKFEIFFRFFYIWRFILNSCPRLAWTPGFGEIISSFGAKMQLAYYFENQLVTLRIFYDLKLKTIILRRQFQVFWLSNCYNKSYATYVLEFRGYEFSKLSTFPKCEFCQKEAKYSKSMEWENLNSKSRNPVGNFGQKPQSNFQLTALWWNGSIAK